MSKKNAQLSKAERAAAVRREHERRERSRQMLVVGGVVLAIIAIVVVGYLVQSSRDTTGEAADAPAGGTETYGVTIGPDDAPVKVVVYEDFLCPVCGIFEGETRDRLQQLADDGDVQVEYRPFNLLSQLGDYSLRATNAFAAVLDAAGPEVAMDFHDRLFAAQPPESGPFPDDNELVALAVDAGAEEAEVTDAINKLSFEQWVVNADDQASKAGVVGTPTVVVNDEVVEGADLGAVIDSMFERIEAA